jgi:acyl-CoA dehydrogenase family protein 9
MSFENFLTSVYFGRLNQAVFNKFRDLQADDKTQKIIDKYFEVSRQYPAHYLEKKGGLSKEILKKLGEIEFFGLNIPTDYGGTGLSLHQYLKVVEETTPQSMAMGFTALAHLSIGTKGIVLFGTEEQKRKYLAPAAAGEMIFAYALTEPKKGSDAQNIETTAVLSEDDQFYILNGNKTYITNANYAGAMTVFAQLDPARPGFMGAFIVETSWDGVNIGKDISKMGLKASSTAAVQFKNVRVPKENLLGQPGDGFKIAMAILNYGRLALGAASSGMMKQSLRDMAKRSSSRTQFGVPINHFELVQEMMVKAKVNSYVTSAMTAFAAGMLEDSALAPVAVESSHCKLFGTNRAWDTLYDALQVAGGSGYLSTQPYEKRMRDFRVTTIFEGTTEIHSIYPALFMMRNLKKHLLSNHTGKISQMVFIIKEIFRGKVWKAKFGHKEMSQAAQVANAIAKSIRINIIAGFIFYGEKVLQRQFFLRRITFLSLYFFGILAMLARIESERKAAGRVAEDLKLLAFFVEEARQYRRENKRIFSYKKDLLHKKIYKEAFA